MQWSRFCVVRSIYSIYIVAEPIIHAIEILKPRSALRQTVVVASLVDKGRFKVVQNDITRVLVFAGIPGSIGGYS
jgi:hypothetical protein